MGYAKGDRYGEEQLPWLFMDEELVQARNWISFRLEFAQCVRALCLGRNCEGAASAVRIGLRPRFSVVRCALQACSESKLQGSAAYIAM